MKRYEHYKLGKYHFIYDYQEALVGNGYRLKKDEEIDDFMRRYVDYIQIGKTTYEVADWVGLRVENWKNKEVRNEYLEMYINEIEEEEAYMLEELKWEFGF